MAESAGEVVAVRVKQSVEVVPDRESRQLDAGIVMSCETGVGTKTKYLG